MSTVHTIPSTQIFECGSLLASSVVNENESLAWCCVEFRMMEESWINNLMRTFMSGCIVSVVVYDWSDGT